MAQNKQPETDAPESDNAQVPDNIPNIDDSADDTETLAAVASETKSSGDDPAAPSNAPAPTPGDTVNLEGKTNDNKAAEKSKQSAQKSTTSKANGEIGDAPRKRSSNANGNATNGRGRNDGDDDAVRGDRQIAQNRHQDDAPGQGRQVRRDEDDGRQYDTRRDTEQHTLFDEDDDYYDRRPRQPERDRDPDYDRGRRAAQGYGHSYAQSDDERLNREYGSDYRRYADAGYDERNQYRSRDRAYDEGGQYQARPYQGARPNDNGRDFEREQREQPRNRWREPSVDARYEDPYHNHRNGGWSSQGNQDRHRDGDRDDNGRYSNERPRDEGRRDEGRYGNQDRGYDQSNDRFAGRQYGNQDERGYNEPRRPGEPVAGNRSNYPAAREDDRGNPGRWRDERRDYRETEADDRYEPDRGPGRRR